MLEVFTEDLTKPILLTLTAAAGSGLMFAVFSPVAALYLARSTSAASRILGFIVTLPLVFPPIALGYILLVFLGSRGLGGFLSDYGIRIVFSEAAVVIAAFIAGLPLAVKPLVGALQSERIEALEFMARVHGAGAARTFFTVTLPLVRNQWLSGLLLGISRASGEVGITMMIGGNISGETNTLPLEIFNAVSRADFDSATALCMLLSSFTLVLYIAVERIQKSAYKL